MGYRNPRYYLLATPNWRDRVRIGRAYKTTVTEALSGGEQRAGLRSNPRRSVRWNVDAMSAKESSYLQRFFFKYQNELIGTPLWADCALLTSAAASGQKELAVNSTTYKEFEVGGEVVIFSDDDWDTYEVGIVVSLTATKVTLRANLTSTWPVNSEVYPLIRARLEQSLSGIMNTDRHLSALFEVTESLEGTTTTTTTVTGSTTYSSTTSSTSSTASTTSSTTSSTASTTSTVSTTSSTASSTSTASTTSSTSSTASTSSTSSTTSSTSSTASTTSSTSTTSTISTSTVSTTTYTEYPGTDYYETDFREYTLGVEPSDWTERFNTGDGTAQAQASADGYGLKDLNIVHTGAASTYGISWDDIGSPETVEIVARIRAKQKDILRHCGVFIRGSGAGGSENGYFVYIQPSAATHQVLLYKCVAGSWTLIGNSVLTYTPYYNWYWVRFMAIGDQIKVKAWTNHFAEPSPWNIEVTDSSVSSGGWVGVTSDSDSWECDYFGVMLDRSDMPLPQFSTTTTSTTTSTSSTASSTASSTTYTEYLGTDYYETDFREYTTGVQPADWTTRWDELSVVDFDVETTNGEFGGKALEAVNTSGRYPGISWDDIGMPATVELLCKIQIGSDTYSDPYIIVRGSGTEDPAIENGYGVRFNTYDDEINLVKFTNGALSQLSYAAAGYNMFANTYHWVRFRAIGNKLNVKVWERNAEEPASWTIDYIDTSSPILGGGWVGIHSDSEDWHCDYFGVMLDRSDMPLRVFTTTTTTTSSTTTTTTT